MSTNVPITVARGNGLELTMIDNRGVKLLPDGISDPLLINAYGCRFTSGRGGTTSKKTEALLGRGLEQSFEIVQNKTLRTCAGAAGKTLSQGQ